MDFDFFMPAKIISGDGCLVRQGGELASLGKRCLIVTGRSSATVCGALEDAVKALETAGIKCRHFAGIGANPRLSQCQAAAFAAQDMRADFILGIGGGSPMDAAKAAAWLAANNVADGEGLMSGRLSRAPLPLALVGTTAGTGSEVSAVSVLTMDADGRKRSVTDPRLFARLVYADPRYTYSSPRGLTVSAALDAFSHVVEGWFAPACGDVVSAFGEKALALLGGGLRRLAAGDGLPDESGREALYYGSLWAGMVLCATGTAFPHPMSYILTEDFQIPHGMACAVFLPAFLSRAEKYAPERAARLFALCGGRDGIFAALEAPIICDGRMTREQADGYAARWEGNKNFTRSPGGFTPGDAKALLTALFTAE